MNVLIPSVMLAFLTIGLVVAARSGRMHLLGAIFALLGAFGFFGPTILRGFGATLERVEFPSFIETVTIAGPEGQRFAISMPLQRVQRYSAKGDFEMGWFVDGAGGSLAIGLTQDDKIAVIPFRKRRFDFFNADGSVAHPSIPIGDVRKREFSSSRAIAPGLLENSDIRIKYAQQVSNPTPSLFAFAMIPLWHPLIGLLMFVVAMVISRFVSEEKSAGADKS